MKFELTLLLIVHLFGLLSSRSIDGETEETNHHITNHQLMFANPFEWAWADYRKTFVVLLCLMTFSIALNVFFYVKYLAHLVRVNLTRQRIVRLQPTYDINSEL